MARSRRVGALPSDIGALIDELGDHEERLRTLEAPAGVQLAGTDAKTQANIIELLTRRTLANEDSLYSQGVDLSTPLPFMTPDLAPVAFTLAERRKVYLRSTVYANMLAFHNGTGTIFDPQVVVISRIKLTNVAAGTSDTVSTPTEIGAGGNAGQRALARSGGRIFNDDYRTLNPGDYVVATTVEVTVVTGTSASQANIFYPKTSVEIMEKAP